MPRSVTLLLTTDVCLCSSRYIYFAVYFYNFVVHWHHFDIRQTTWCLTVRFLNHVLSRDVPRRNSRFQSATTISLLPVHKYRALPGTLVSTRSAKIRSANPNKILGRLFQYSVLRMLVNYT